MGADIDMGDINKRHVCFVKQDRLENLFPKISHMLPMRFHFLLSVILKNEELIWSKLVWSNTCTLNTTCKFNTTFEALYWQKTMLMKTLEMKSSRSYNKRWYEKTLKDLWKCGTFLWCGRSTGTLSKMHVSHAMRDGWQVWKRTFYKCKESIKLHTKSVTK